MSVIIALILSSAFRNTLLSRSEKANVHALMWEEILWIVHSNTVDECVQVLLFYLSSLLVVY